MSRVKQQPETRYCEWITPNTKTSTTPAWKYVLVIRTINSCFQSPTVVNRPTLYMTMSSTTTTSSSSPKQKGSWYGSNRMIQSKRGFGNVKPRGHEHMSEIHAILSVGVCVCIYMYIILRFRTELFRPSHPKDFLYVYGGSTSLMGSHY